ncbi:FAD-dependent oxidoreductase [Georhizobium sp. MAB10]|uniref:FAD-dependent oxidoreductase n=1 Tax=Georhizobium sp. MAB10 TaxID=3028319 RepID=UPI003855C757
MSEPMELDLVIIGGGVAGLWLLNRATQDGLSAVLIEKTALGGGQTRYAQGIIHGGTKYALSGAMTPAADAIGRMPDLWRDCLKGRGELDLQGVRELSDATYLWSAGSLTSQVTSFFASKAMRSRVDRVDDQDKPSIFQLPDASGSVYRLNEFVLDMPSLVETLAAPLKDRIIRAAAETMSYGFNDAGNVSSISLENGLVLKPRALILTSGAGHEALAARLNIVRPQLQRRPLHMVVARHTVDLPLFGHCIGMSSSPLLTVTSHPSSDGHVVWYLGGGLAETGVERTEDQQIAVARETIDRLLPQLRPFQAEWATLRIDRAEPLQPGGARPDGAFLEEVGNCLVAWPTKLALAPELARLALGKLRARLGEGAQVAVDWSRLSDLPRPKIARLPWKETIQWT